MSDTNGTASTDPQLPYHVPVNVYTKRGTEGKRLQAITLQRAVLHDALTAEDSLTRARAVHAWTELQEQIRIIDGKLKPGSINARDDSAGKLKSRVKSKQSQPAGPVVYPMPSEESSPAVNDNGEKQGDPVPPKTLQDAL